MRLFGIWNMVFFALVFVISLFVGGIWLSALAGAGMAVGYWFVRESILRYDIDKKLKELEEDDNGTD